VHDHEIYDNTPSSYLDDIADIGEKHIRLSYPNFILLLARLDTDYMQVPTYVGDPWEYHPNAPEPDQPTFSPAAPHSDIEVRLQIIDEYLWLYEKYSSTK